MHLSNMQQREVAQITLNECAKSRGTPLYMAIKMADAPVLTQGSKRDLIPLFKFLVNISVSITKFLYNINKKDHTGPTN